MKYEKEFKKLMKLVKQNFIKCITKDSYSPYGELELEPIEFEHPVNNIELLTDGTEFYDGDENYVLRIYRNRFTVECLDDDVICDECKFEDMNPVKKSTQIIDKLKGYYESNWKNYWIK